MLSTTTYSADLTAGSLKPRESRLIAGLLLAGANEQQFREVVVTQNVFQARTSATAVRLVRLIRRRLEAMDSGLWKMVHAGDQNLSTQAILASAIKHSALLRDFMDLVLRDEYRLLHTELKNACWSQFLLDCEARDPGVANWSDSTRNRLRSTVFQILAQAGFLGGESKRELKKFVALHELRDYLSDRGDHGVLRCLQMP